MASGEPWRSIRRGLQVLGRLGDDHDHGVDGVVRDAPGVEEGADRCGVSPARWLSAVMGSWGSRVWDGAAGEGPGCPRG